MQSHLLQLSLQFCPILAAHSESSHSRAEHTVSAHSTQGCPHRCTNPISQHTIGHTHSHTHSTAAYQMLLPDLQSAGHHSFPTTLHTQDIPVGLPTHCPWPACGPPPSQWARYWPLSRPQHRAAVKERRHSTAQHTVCRTLGHARSHAAAVMSINSCASCQLLHQGCMRVPALLAPPHANRIEMTMQSLLTALLKSHCHSKWHVPSSKPQPLMQTVQEAVRFP